MPHFLIKKEEIKNDSIELLSGDNFFHLTRVLRVKPHEKIKFIDENKIVYFCEITEILKDSLKARILSKEKSNRSLKTELFLVQAVLASDSQNILIANSIQSGVKGIYPVMSDNVSISKKALENKVSKWNKISYENFKQCERADVAPVFEISDLKSTLDKFKPCNVLIFAEKLDNYNLNNCLNDIDKTDKIAVVIGPEGGFSDEEFKYFIEKKYKLITLGCMIYKAQNAATAALSNVISRLEE